MDKMKFESPDMTAQNIDRIAAMFPNCITEMLDEEHSTPEKKVYKRAVNFELLKQMLSPDVVDGDEAYEFTWVGKKAAIVEANKPIRKTLRPCMAESKDWDTTENLYIEGDNLEVLKLLQESYLGKVKMIYIDPPYNTGNDFIYADDFMRSQEEENAQMGMYDEDENRLFKNTDTNGRFHSDWCSMIYSRLMLARNLLTDDGAIAISIDDNEIDNLGEICDEVFGSQNFVSKIIVQNNPRGRQSDSFVATVHEYLLCYAKDSTKCLVNGTPLTEDQIAEYCYSDGNGAYRLLGLRQRGVASLREDRPDMFFPIYVDPTTQEVSLDFHDGWLTVVPKKSDGRDGRWMWGKQKCIADKSRLVARMIERRSEYDIFVKDYLVRENGQRTRKYKTIWDDKCINNQVGTQEVKKLLDGEYMSFPKSCAYIQMICQMLSSSSGIVLDFFSGSATTAHAVMQLNAEDGGHRKFIMVQLPEKCDETSEAYKAGYKTICEIGKERIRRAGDKIKSESPLTTQDLDIGFRVLKLDDTNMKDVYYAPDDYDQGMIAALESNIKDDRTDLDLLFGCLIDWGLPLSLPYKSEQLGGCTVHTYNDGDLIACFDANIPESVVKEIAQRRPLRAVFRDSGFASSPEKINVFEIFKLYMPEDAGDISKRVRVL
jgi:adenine-specific DNA-methyltransferase